MQYDLAQIAKAKGIHRIVAMTAILSYKPASSGNGQNNRRSPEQETTLKRRKSDAD